MNETGDKFTVKCIHERFNGLKMIGHILKEEIFMNIYKLKYQHYKDIDNKILTVFVEADSEEDVKKFAKAVSYSVKDIEKLSDEEYKKERAKDESFGLEHADKYIDKSDEYIDD
ncbi:Uncharacterised protein [Staphylococcus petrasii]|uniref:Uncharacterized protein n=2 Tax=Staphylococcus petrasii TaxID=1276936 RepID=A0A380FVT8_9STAP|nr:Uncharacterised protein [Staphylococcus petrasii]